ncbi:TPA: hypothetical protein G9F27_000800 [Salmonella enterica]|uniref:Uncharacterized protein n=1 Tax=Salmonella enterica TaxID=28901 RepID=A0A743P263_SALER|nr:hypothetical protein [Salmonella enterica]
MNEITMTLMIHAENALNFSGETREVLKMWLNSVSENEALKVGAVISLLDNSIRELEQAREYFTAHKADGGSENEK